jgi:hypothetical protein
MFCLKVKRGERGTMFGLHSNGVSLGLRMYLVA